MTLLNKYFKVSLALSFLLLVSTTTTAQESKETVKEEAPTGKVGVFEFEEDVIDYGVIKQNADGKRVFKFKNVGEAPIVISQAKGSCGCTVPTYSKNMIPPGESGEIKVKYATNRIGKFSKTVTLTSNASEATKVLRIKGEVLKPEVPAEETPAKKEQVPAKPAE